MASGISVRPATAEDLEAIRDLAAGLAQMQSGWRVFPPREGFLEEIVSRYRRLLDSDRAIVLVVGTGEVEGMACAEVVIPSRFSDEPAVELSGVMVREGSRGRGLGRALVLSAASFARDRGVGRLVLDTFGANEEAVSYWEELGFSQRVVQFTASADDLLNRL